MLFEQINKLVFVMTNNKLDISVGLQMIRSRNHFNRICTNQMSLLDDCKFKQHNLLIGLDLPNVTWQQIRLNFNSF